MTTHSKIEDMLSTKADSSNTEFKTVLPADDSSDDRLKSVLSDVDREDTTKAPSGDAETGFTEGRLAEHLERELLGDDLVPADDPQPVDPQPIDPQTIAEDTVAVEADFAMDPVEEVETVVEAPAIGMPEAHSARLLEIRRKQQSFTDMRDKIRDGASLLASLGKHADVIASYFEKAEVEIMHLESIEAKSATLSANTDELARRCQDMKATIEEQSKQISLLEAVRATSRDVMGNAKLELARLSEENRVLASEISTREAKIVKLESDKQSLLEKIEVQQRDHEEIVSAHQETRKRLDAVEHATQQKDKELATTAAEIKDLKKANERNSMDLTDVQSKYADLKSKYQEQKTRLEERTFEAEAMRSEFDEILRLKENRIVELESRLEAANKQLISRDELVESLSQTLDTIGNAKDPEPEAAVEETPPPAKKSASSSRSKARAEAAKDTD
ncbi:MAG: hypothetical protein AAGL24_04300 [Pseudomonadota bacterium]